MTQTKQPPANPGRFKDVLLRLIRQGIGRSGANADYVIATHDHLRELGVADPVIARLAAALQLDHIVTPRQQHPICA